MQKLKIILLIFLPLWTYVHIFHLPYYVWPFPLTQNWFADNSLVLFRDIIYHHTPLPLFIIYFNSKILGNTAQMLQITSFILSLGLGYVIYFTGRLLSEKIGVVSLALFLISFFPIFHNFNLEEITAALFTLLSTYFFLKFLQNQSNIWVFLSGIFVSLGLMGKQVIVGVMLTFIITLFILLIKRKVVFSTLIRSALIFSFGLSLGILPFILYFLVNNALWDFFYWNVIFNLTQYPQQSTPYALKEGLFASFWLFASLVPGFLLFFRKKINFNLRIGMLALILNTAFLSVSLLPSFLTYKALPFYPYPLILWAVIFQFIKQKMIIAFLIVGMLGLLPHVKSFYIDYFPTEVFRSDYILDYGKNELSVVEWLKLNTSSDERIMNLGHHYITTLADRLPHNKYVYIFPWLVMPFDKSAKEILSDPPSVVIVDNQTLADWPSLSKWPFVIHIKKHYKSVADYGTYEIFVKDDK